MKKINWPNLFVEKSPNPDQDWRLMLIIWFSAVLVIFVAGVIAFPLLFKMPIVAVGDDPTGGSSTTINRDNLEAVVKMINDRANRAELLRSAPPNLIDPGR